MTEWLETVTSSSQWQFVVGVLVLVFGSQAVLSETNLKGKFWGLGAPARWWKRRQTETAEKELTETIRLQGETDCQHRYIIWVTSILRNIEIWAADQGHTLPPPEFKTYTEWKEGDEAT